MTTMHGVAFPKHDTIRFGLIGAGERGRYLLHELLACEGVQVKAVADLRAEHAERAAEPGLRGGPACAAHTSAVQMPGSACSKKTWTWSTSPPPGIRIPPMPSLPCRPANTWALRFPPR